LGGVNPEELAVSALRVNAAVGNCRIQIEKSRGLTFTQKDFLTVEAKFKNRSAFPTMLHW